VFIRAGVAVLAVAMAALVAGGALHAGFIPHA
jgi:hypothetical protein